MISAPRRRIDMNERGRLEFPSDGFNDELALRAVQLYGKHIKIRRTGRDGGSWTFEAAQWVGILPLGPTHSLYITPKVPIHNLFRMLEWAWDASFQAYSGLVELDDLEDVFERLAKILALRVLDRLRRGLARNYRPAEDRLPYQRGRLNVARHVREPERLNLPCLFEEHTADVDDNRILAWTLRVIALSGLATERCLGEVRRAFHGVAGQVELRPYRAADCVGRVYHRLNQDYSTLHALCRFFLETTGPAHRRGDHWMIPFAVNTETLFEQFVVAWLRANLPSGWRLEAQRTEWLVGSSSLPLYLDIVIFDALDKPFAVLDTKFKGGGTVERSDLYQIHTYAAQLGCPNAFLVYPEARRAAYDVTLGSAAPVRVRSVGFDLSGDLNEAGQRFLAAILE